MELILMIMENPNHRFAPIDISGRNRRCDLAPKSMGTVIEKYCSPWTARHQVSDYVRLRYET